MLPECTDNGQRLSHLSPERQAKFLIKMRNQCYRTDGWYRDELGQDWELEDITEALKKLPHIRGKKFIER